MQHRFFALISRMRYIGRWGLMRNTFEENIQEQALEQAAPTITEWSESTVSQLVERVTILSATEVLVQLKGGKEIHERLE